MRQIRVSKRHRQKMGWLEPLPRDPRDPDIVRAKEAARSSPPGRRERARSQRSA